MQVGNIQNQYINNYYNEGIQTANQQTQTRALEGLSEYQQMQYKREQEQRQYQWMAYVMMMQFFAKQGMWNLIDQMRIQKTLDLQA